MPSFWLLLKDNNDGIVGFVQLNAVSYEDAVRESQNFLVQSDAYVFENLNRLFLFEVNCSWDVSILKEHALKTIEEIRKSEDVEYDEYKRLLKKFDPGHFATQFNDEEPCDGCRESTCNCVDCQDAVKGKLNW